MFLEPEVPIEKPVEPIKQEPIKPYEAPKQKDWAVVQEIVQARRVEAILTKSKNEF
jgi:hypothetical protein